MFWNVNKLYLDIPSFIIWIMSCDRVQGVHGTKCGRCWFVRLLDLHIPWAKIALKSNWTFFSEIWKIQAVNCRCAEFQSYSISQYHRSRKIFKRKIRESIREQLEKTESEVPFLGGIFYWGSALLATFFGYCTFAQDGPTEISDRNDIFARL